MRTLNLSEERLAILGFLSLIVNTLRTFMKFEVFDLNHPSTKYGFVIKFAIYPLLVLLWSLFFGRKKGNKGASWPWFFVGYFISLFHLFVFVPLFYLMMKSPDVYVSHPKLVIYLWVLISFMTFLLGSIFLNKKLKVKRAKNV
jgi:hypothetical protein